MTPIAPRSIPAFILLLLTTVLALGVSGQVSAEPRWVNDEIRITFRAGPGENFRIVRYLTTGARLETATPPADRFPAASMEGWTYLRDANGDHGWVRDQYLLQQPPARVRMEGVQSELDAATANISALTAERSALQSENAQLVEQLESSAREISELESRLAAARGGLELVDANQALEQTVAELRASNERLEIEKQTIGDRNLKEWFLIGAGVLGLGLIMGLILPSLRRKPDRWGGGSL